MRVLLSLSVAALVATACGVSSDVEPVTVAPTVAPAPAATPATPSPVPTAEPAAADLGPGGYSFDRSDPEAGIANIMEAFATDEATATCVYEAWGDVANVAPEDLTPELMVYEVCGTSILRMMTGTG